MDPVPLPRTSRPALRALDSAGYTHLHQLDGVPMNEILSLHGMGPKGIGTLRRTMAEHGWAFADDDPSVGAVPGGIVKLEAGRRPARNDNATTATSVDPASWVAGLAKPRQRSDGAALLVLFGDATGQVPAMWGPSIVGYGELHYVYESGREGNMARVGFSPRSASNSLYGLLGHDGSDELLAKLGKHRVGAGCLYVNKLADVDLGVLRELVTLAWRAHDV